jgi:hypothetical protein
MVEPTIDIDIDFDGMTNQPSTSSPMVWHEDDGSQNGMVVLVSESQWLKC